MNDTSAPAGPSFMKRLRRFVLLAVLAVVVLFGLYTWASWAFTYSEGDRAGYVQKFSKKGWICKTWEGELAMANIPGSMPQIFQFTVWDDQVAALKSVVAPAGTVAWIVESSTRFPPRTSPSNR